MAFKRSTVRSRSAPPNSKNSNSLPVWQRFLCLACVRMCPWPPCPMSVVEFPKASDSHWCPAFRSWHISSRRIAHPRNMARMPAVSSVARSASTDVRFSSPQETLHVLKHLFGWMGMVALKGGQVVTTQKTQLVKVDIGLRQRCSSLLMVGGKHPIETVCQLKRPPHPPGDDGQIVRHASRREAGSPHKLPSPLDPVISLGSRLVVSGGAESFSSHFRFLGDIWHSVYG